MRNGTVAVTRFFIISYTRRGVNRNEKRASGTRGDAKFPNAAPFRPRNVRCVRETVCNVFVFVPGMGLIRIVDRFRKPAIDFSTNRVVN